ncbi:SAM-dependent methyltransferase, partial [Citrobacter werkmanii]|nr:SAM-dependent methyltransferase [Citrobacter werkmanii]
MKPARIPQTVVAPVSWDDLPWGEYYREALEHQLNPWFA